MKNIEKNIPGRYRVGLKDILNIIYYIRNQEDLNNIDQTVSQIDIIIPAMERTINKCMKYQTDITYNFYSSFPKVEKSDEDDYTALHEILNKEYTFFIADIDNENIKGSFSVWYKLIF